MPSRRAASARLPPVSCSARAIIRCSSRATAPGRSSAGAPSSATAGGASRKAKSAAPSVSPAGQHRGPLQRVAQLAHVAGPRIGAAGGAAASALQPAAERARGNAPPAGATSSGRSRSGGSYDRHHAQAIEQILAEPALAHPRRQVAVGRGDDPHIDRHRPPADRRHHPLLQHAQNLGLHRRVHVADLVQQQRAAGGLAERAGTVGDRAGEGAADMAEQLLSRRAAGIAAQLTATNGPAARRPWRWIARATTSLPVPVSPVISTVASLSDDAPDRLLHLAHRGTRADEGVLLVRSGRRDRGVRAGAQHPGEQVGQRLAADRLGQVVEGAEPHRVDRVRRGRVRGQDRDRRRRGRRAQPAQHGRCRPDRASAGRAAPRRAAPRPPAPGPCRRRRRRARRWPRSPTVSASASRSAGSSSTIRTVFIPAARW